MNRRSFLTALGSAAIGAAALEVLDPEKFLWVPGAKTIIDLGATKHLEAPTDAQIAKLFDTRNGFIGAEAWDGRSNPLDIQDRDIRLDIGGTSFRYKGEKLVSKHSAEELKLLERPFWPHGGGGLSRPNANTRAVLLTDAEAAGVRHEEVDWSLIEMPEDEE